MNHSAVVRFPDHPLGDPVPPMFWLRDPDENSPIIVQPST
jgi:hypothetical protein